jgi:hypothetical protein
VFDLPQIFIPKRIDELKREREKMPGKNAPLHNHSQFLDFRPCLFIQDETWELNRPKKHENQEFNSDHHKIEHVGQSYAPMPCKMVNCHNLEVNHCSHHAPLGQRDKTSRCE